MGYEKTSDETLNRNFSFLALFVPHSIQLYKWKKINKKLFAFFLMQSNWASKRHIFLVHLLVKWMEMSFQIFLIKEQYSFLSSKHPNSMYVDKRNKI